MPQIQFEPLPSATFDGAHKLRPLIGNPANLPYEDAANVQIFTVRTKLVRLRREFYEKIAPLQPCYL